MVDGVRISQLACCRFCTNCVRQAARHFARRTRGTPETDHACPARSDLVRRDAPRQPRPVRRAYGRRMPHSAQESASARSGCPGRRGGGRDGQTNQAIFRDLARFTCRSGRRKLVSRTAPADRACSGVRIPTSRLVGTSLISAHLPRRAGSSAILASSSSTSRPHHSTTLSTRNCSRSSEGSSAMRRSSRLHTACASSSSPPSLATCSHRHVSAQTQRHRLRPDPRSRRRPHRRTRHA